MRRRSLRVRVDVLLLLALAVPGGCARGRIEGTNNESTTTTEPTPEPFAPASDDATTAVSDAVVPDDVDAGAPADAANAADTATVVDSGAVLDTGVAIPVDAGPVTGKPVSSTVKDIKFTNARGETIDARMFMPAGTTTTRHPAVIVLHGSGGLFKDPTSADLAAGRTCSASMSSQFDRWAARLTARGYVAIFPDSFGSRGYCDEETDPRRLTVLPPVNGDENGKTRRLLYRLYDLDGASRYLCAHERVKCDALGVVGFSNGGSAVAMGLHHKLNEALAAFALTSRAKSIGVAIPPLPKPLPYFRTGVAYYPGCGFDGLMTESTDPSRIEEFFYPRVDLQVLIGTEDVLLEHCSKLAIGTREIQADTYAAKKALPDRYDIKVYAGANHSFDNAGCEKSGADTTDPDIKACADATDVTMSLLRNLETP